eukprot:scaffold144057_cov35-Attheya_sp.AAC.1
MELKMLSEEAEKQILDLHHQLIDTHLVTIAEKENKSRELENIISQNETDAHSLSIQQDDLAKEVTMLTANLESAESESTLFQDR